MHCTHTSVQISKSPSPKVININCTWALDFNNNYDKSIILFTSVYYQWALNRVLLVTNWIILPSQKFVNVFRVFPYIYMVFRNFRKYYGFWLLLANGLGHADHFTGPFDRVMAFFFYIPNLLVAEVFIRSRNYKTSSLLNLFSTIMLLLMTTFLLLGTYYFTKFYWGPAIVGWLTGS